MGKKKKIIISLVVTVVVIGLITGILLAVKKKTKNKKTVEVFSVSELSENSANFGSWKTMSGRVIIKNEQKIYLNAQQQVAEVLVKEGDEVKAGDVLMRYDTTSQNLQLELMAADVEIARVSVVVAERELEKLKNTTPVEPTTEPPVTETPTTEAPTTEAPSTEDPGATPTDAEQNNKPQENPTPEPAPVPAPTPTPVPEPEPMPPEDLEPTYTKEELEKAIQDKENEIKSLRTSYQLEQIKYEIASYQSANGDVLANFDGVVKTLADQEESILNNEPFMVIGTDDGYTVQSDIGEFSLMTVGIGNTVTMMNYENGMTYTGTITEISTIPSDNNYYYGMVETYYPITIAVDDPEGLTQNSWLEVSLDGGVADESTGVMCLQTAFVMSENGNSYVMKQVDGKLEKCYVKTGKNYWGSYVEILSGLSVDDYVAFPYLSSAVEGTKTVETSFYDSSLFR
ncbi:MAG: HlyD family efflux transporter periplasmic adaptor subunit [Clostridium sp.]|nr:HlyD family efflux transporter periplasmic adaptor subunit [Clostridium sp.]